MENNMTRSHLTRRRVTHRRDSRNRRTQPTNELGRVDGDRDRLCPPPAKRLRTRRWASYTCYLCICLRIVVLIFGGCSPGGGGVLLGATIATRFPPSFASNSKQKRPVYVGNLSEYGFFRVSILNLGFP
jgi:hypothetical protein